MAWRVSSPELVGRAIELTALETAWVSAVSGVGRIATITGEAGIGKTRLADEFADRHKGHSLLVRAECPNTGLAQALPLAGFRAALSDLVPDVESRSWEPSQLADRVARRLLERCRDEPVLLLVEDLHWADQSTLNLVDYLARVLRARPALVMVTLRIDPPPSAVVADRVSELERLPHAVRVEVPRLGPDEVVRQLHGIFGRPPGADVADRIIARADGVPFFVEELAALERSPSHAAVPSLPDRLQDLLLRRIRELSPEATTVLRAAAAAAGDVDDAALRAVTGLDMAVVHDQLRALVGLGVLTTPGRGYRFRHALLREAVEADLLPYEVATLHTSYGRLVDQGMADADDMPGNHQAAVAAAYHWWRAGDEARAYGAVLAAAESAHRFGAPAEELQLLQRALQLHNEDDQPDVSELSFRAADAAMRAGDPRAAYKLYEDAWRGLGQGGDPERVARILTEETMLLDGLGEPLPHVEQALRGLLETLPPGPSPARSHALEGLFAFLWRRREYDQAWLVVQEALDGAPPDDPLSVALQLHLATVLAGRPDQAGEALERFAAVAVHAQHIGASHYATMARVNQSDFLLALGRAEESAAAARDGLRIGDTFPMSEVVRDYLVGNLAEALTALGHHEEAQAVLEDRLRVDRTNMERGSLYMILALVRLRRGELAEAVEAAEAAHERLDGRSSDPQVIVPLATLDAELALARGDPVSALTIVQDVAPAHGHHVWGRLMWPLVHVAARAASPRRPEWLTALIDELDALYQTAPAQPNHAAQVRAALSGQAARVHQPPPADQLTARELDVLRLVGCGLGNSAVAAELVISPKTASVHVSHILDKLGARSRGEAVAIALRRGILTSSDLKIPAQRKIRQ